MERVLRYPGSKGNIARQLVGLMPEHHSYVEPYFGGGSVLFSKPPSDIETVNDLDSDVAGLFRCIREDAGRLAGLVAATPYSREEYERQFGGEAGGDAGDDPYRKALGFLIRCWQGHGFRTAGGMVGWGNDVAGRERAYALRNWYRLPAWVEAAAERLRGVQIECRPALEVIRRFDREGVFMYLDPPYLPEVRSGRNYRHEMTAGDHEELLGAIRGSRAKVMISGYRSEMYDSLLDGWSKAEFRSCAEHGRPRTEAVWMNYGICRQMSLFDMQGVTV